MTIKRDEEMIAIGDRLPVIPLREIVVFPYMVIPLPIAREKSIKALERSMSQDRLLFLTAQRNSEIEEPTREDVYRTGVVARILQVSKLPNGVMRVLVEGLVRARVTRFLPNSSYMEVRIEVIEVPNNDTDVEVQARLRASLGQFTDYVKLNQQIPDEALLTLDNGDDPSRLADTMAAYLIQTPQVKQELIEATSLPQQLETLSSILAVELDILEIKTQIDGEVRDRIHKAQREFFLQEQIKVIKQELGEFDEPTDEIDELAQSISQIRMPKAVEEKAVAELNKLQLMHPTSPEATVVRNYLDWLIAVPWTKKTRDTRDLNAVGSTLDADHFGLTKPKERIIEYLAVLQRTRKIRGPILCLVGPPGVGKTSLGKSIARAMKRKFIRMSLGGVRDEAEIRGHRRTYIGSMPGRIIQAMRRAGTVNPVILLDEIDKLGADYRGDPASALLEVLDPEQNNTFNDHYLEVDYDLSRVLFITTANTTFSIPAPLRDRMEIIHLSGYLEYEKLAIAQDFLVPKQLEANGLDKDLISFRKQALTHIIKAYTKEAGVRSLERQIGTVCRKVTRQVVQNDVNSRVQITPPRLPDYLGAPPFDDSELLSQDTVGVATGLAWTDVGGELLTIEVSILHRSGPGRFTITGQLGDVMQESARAALSYIRGRAEALDLDPDFYTDVEIHVHVPEGAVPKDGPSAGIGLATALCSALTGRPIRRDVAMTGEVTLRGSILPIGGLNEKLMAAQRAGIKHVIIPKRNKKNVAELPDEIRKGLDLHLVETMDEVLDLALGVTVSDTGMPAPRRRKSMPQPDPKSPVM